ncbi:hypothetical protein AB2L27_17165 [Kineococcus sp. LSe6-4]|uniref:Uncharacterized protein n=1 Tax=Kineococcus halophytocola TaxID=3234027 RepID=A0ABV4H6S5_9ACTN
MSGEVALSSHRRAQVREVRAGAVHLHRDLAPVLESAPEHGRDPPGTEEDAVQRRAELSAQALIEPGVDLAPRYWTEGGSFDPFHDLLSRHR